MITGELRNKIDGTVEELKSIIAANKNSNY